MSDGPSVDESIYGVPSVKEWAKQDGFYMRKDLVDKYDIDIEQIETYEDLVPVFETIKESEPDMYPIANTNMPVGEVIGGSNYDKFIGFGVVSIFDSDTEVVNLYEEPEYIEAIETVRDWYEKGYIMKDAATTNDMEIDVIRSGKGFGAFTNIKPGIDVEISNSTGYEIVSVGISEAFQTTSVDWMLSIARNSENPEKAMEFMNLLYSDADIMNLIAIGIEGEHYVLNDEGLATLPEGIEKSAYLQGQWQLGNNFLTHVMEGNDPDLWEQMEEFNNNAIPSPALGFSFNSEPVKTEMAALANVVEQYRKGLESGTLDPEKTLPEFNGKLKATGLNKVIEEQQRQIDEWKASQ